MDIWTIVLAIVVATLGVYFYFIRARNIFKSAGIPCLTPYPVFGNMASVMLRRESMVNQVKNIYDTYPEAKYIGMFEFNTPVILIRDLELLKSVTVKNFEHFVDHRSFVDEVTEPLLGKNLFSLRGERWREVRSILSPAFTLSKMKAMFKLMSQCAGNFADYWATEPAESDSVNTKDAFTRYTNDVIATCAFGISVNSIKDRDNEFYVLGKETTTLGAVRSLKFFISRNYPNLYRTLKMKLFREEASSFFMNIVKTTIRTRKEQGIVRPDMIQLMMEVNEKQEGNALSLEDMTSQAFVFFFGGFDSTSTIMCSTAHEIAINPEVHKRLQAEIDTVLEETNGELTYEAISKMEYLDAVVNETLRMYPVGNILDRVCTKDFELPPALPGCKPYKMKKGSYIWISVHGLHRDPNYFPDPDTFNPDRFLGDRRDVNMAAFVPFGVGPRMCIGNRFAILETKVLIFHLLARCDLKPCEKTPIPINFTTSTIALAPVGGFWVKIKPRSTPSKYIKNHSDAHEVCE